MIERMPALNLAELKAGDALIISSTVGAEAEQDHGDHAVGGRRTHFDQRSQGPARNGSGQLEPRWSGR